MRLFLIPLACVAMMAAGCEMFDEGDDYEYVREDDTIVAPAWAERSPTAADIRRVYPQVALDAGIEARVILLCTVQASRDLACTVDSEGTTGYGFGQAALSVARLFRVKPAEPDAPTAVGRMVRVPIRFAVGS
jgi:periplasmic protein TonB